MEITLYLATLLKVIGLTIRVFLEREFRMGSKKDGDGWRSEN